MSAAGVRVASVVGARPQFVKAAVVSRALAARGVHEDVIHTGQHFDDNMSAIFFTELGLDPPARHLGIDSGSHGQMTGRMLPAVEQALVELAPDWVVLYGDTNSTLAGALAAAKLPLPVAHVEAGLRSFDRRMPEEVNRVVTDHLADLLFAPTAAAVDNLRREGIEGPGVVLSGDVMYDAALAFGARAEERSDIRTKLGLDGRPYVLATVHRSENTDHAGRLHAIVDGLAQVAEAIPVVLPLHPRTSASLDPDTHLRRRAARLRVVPPIGYLDMLSLERHAALVVTDSGGVQKEAFFFGVPCVTLRDRTEWVELVELGWNTLLPPTDAAAVAKGVVRALEVVPPLPVGPSPYGDGRSAELIAEVLAERGAG